MIAWAALVTADAYFGWTRTPLAPRDDPQAFFAAAVERLESENRGNAVLILIEQGLIVDAYARLKSTPVFFSAPIFARGMQTRALTNFG